MKVNRRLWEDRRRRFYERMLRDISTGYFDMEILPLVDMVFKLENAFPTSSCSGRIVILSGRIPWRRKDVKILYKAHEPLDPKTVMNIISNAPDENLWFMVQPPILHISCFNDNIASEILKIARSSGFKHSGIIAVTERGYHVEIRGNEVFTVPLRIGGIDIYEQDKLALLVKEASRVLLESKRRIERLEAGLKNLVEKQKEHQNR